MSKSPSLRRIQADVRELALDPSDQYHAAPLENDMFEWHFTIRGPHKTDFEEGIYHGRILLPPEYPFKPPHIMFLTPSGRFEIKKKICLSFSAFHPELWQPAWGIRLIMEALIAFLPSPADGAIGAIDWTSAERKRLAKKSVFFSCPCCGKVVDLLPELKKGECTVADKPSRFEKEIEQLRLAQVVNESKNDKAVDKNISEIEIEDNAIADEMKNNDLTKRSSQNRSFSEIEIGNSEKNKVDVSIPGIKQEAEVEVTPNEQVENNSEQEIVQQQNPFELDIAWLTDPMMNVSIALLSIICFLLVRKAYALSEELHSINMKRF